MTVDSFSQKGTHKQQAWDWQAAFLCVLLILTMSVRLENTHWTPDLGYTESIALAGSMAGLLLGVSIFRKWQRALIFIGYSVFYLPLAVSNVIQTESSGLARLLSLWGRLSASMNLFLQAKPITDHIPFVLTMSILFWFVGAFSGYILTTEANLNKILLLPTIVIMVIQINDGFIPDRIWVLGFYFFLCLMLAGRLNLLRSKVRWQQEGVIAGTQPEYDLNRFILIFSSVIVLITWSIPYPTEFKPIFQKTTKSIKQNADVVQQRLEDLFAALRPSVGKTGVNQFPAQYLLGVMAETSNDLLFKIDLQSSVNPGYLPVRAYDTYKSGHWVGLEGEGVPFDPESNGLPVPDLDGLTRQKLSVKWLADHTKMIVLPPRSIWVSRGSSLLAQKMDDIYVDPIAWMSEIDIENGDQYEVGYYVFPITQKKLKDAGEDYPEWVKQKYLLLDPNFPQAVKDLALEVTRGTTTPFEKASLVTTYLRENYTYSQKVTAAPEKVDPIEYFLFNDKKGYCNYYASAEVLMLRSLGIPSRFVVGYNGGELEKPGQYNFKKKNLHAWPEVFFPEYGWVIFEPTSSIDPIIYPLGEQSLSPFVPNQLNDFADRERNPGMDKELDQPLTTDDSFQQISIFWLKISLGVLTTFVIFYYLYRNRKSLLTIWSGIPFQVQNNYERQGLSTPLWITLWIKWNNALKVERWFAILNICLRMQGIYPEKFWTAAERAEKLKVILPTVAVEITELKNRLEEELFGFEPVKKTGRPLLVYRILQNSISTKLKIWIYGS